MLLGLLVAYCILRYHISPARAGLMFFNVNSPPHPIPLVENQEVYDWQGSEKIPFKIVLNHLKEAIREHHDQSVNDILNFIRRTMTTEVTEILRYLIEQAAKEDNANILQYILGISSVTFDKRAITTITKLGKKNATYFLVANGLCDDFKMMRKACKRDNVAAVQYLASHGAFEVEGAEELAMKACFRGELFVSPKVFAYLFHRSEPLSLQDVADVLRIKKSGPRQEDCLKVIDKEVLWEAFGQHGWKAYTYVLQSAYNPDASVFLKPVINDLSHNHIGVVKKMREFVAENQVGLLGLGHSLKLALRDILLTFEDPELVEEFQTRSPQLSNVATFKILDTLISTRTPAAFRPGLARRIFKLPPRSAMDVTAALHSILLEGFAIQKASLFLALYITFLVMSIFSVTK